MKPQGAEDHVQVMPCGAENGMQDLPQVSFEPISPQATIVFHMADGGFDGTSSVNRLVDGRRHAAFLTATQNGDARDLDTSIALVDKDGLGEAGQGTSSCFLLPTEKVAKIWLLHF